MHQAQRVAQCAAALVLTPGSAADLDGEFAWHAAQLDEWHAQALARDARGEYDNDRGGAAHGPPGAHSRQSTSATHARAVWESVASARDQPWQYYIAGMRPLACSGSLHPIRELVLAYLIQKAGGDARPLVPKQLELATVLSDQSTLSKSSLEDHELILGAVLLICVVSGSLSDKTCELIQKH